MFKIALLVVALLAPRFSLGYDRLRRFRTLPVMRERDHGFKKIAEPFLALLNTGSEGGALDGHHDGVKAPEPVRAGDLVHRRSPILPSPSDLAQARSAEMDVGHTDAEDGELQSDVYECPSSYRPDPDGEASIFQVRDAGRWLTQLCQPGLVWNQTLCRCDYPVDCSRTFRAGRDGMASNAYEQLVSGEWVSRTCLPASADLVWDFRSCRCVWSPRALQQDEETPSCDVMLNMTFDRGVEDGAKGSYVEVGHGLPLPTRRDPSSRRAGNRAAYFTHTALNLWYFSDNEFGSSFGLHFRFRHEKSALGPSDLDAERSTDMRNDRYQILISNGCQGPALNYTLPSLAIGYRPSDQSYMLVFEAGGVRRVTACTHPSYQSTWHKMSLVYENGTLTLRVDGQQCITSSDFSGSVQKTPCPLTLGADPMDRQAFYTGYFDDLLIHRGCDHRENLDGPV